MKIAAAQTNVSPDISANATSIRTVISEAAAKGVRLVSFCEGALSGYAKTQIATPDDWQVFDWERQEAELRSLAALCRHLRIYAVIGAAHRLQASPSPHNSLYVISDAGELLTRYDKRLLSNSELNGWYRPGTEPVLFDIDGYSFGCAICIESQFPEVFMEYEKSGVDAVIFSSYGIPEHFQIALRAHAGLNCIWISAATPSQEAQFGPAGILGPDGKWAAVCEPSSVSCLALSTLDRSDPRYAVALQKARPWRAQARAGEIYRERICADVRSEDRRSY